MAIVHTARTEQCDSSRKASASVPVLPPSMVSTQQLHSCVVSIQLLFQVCSLPSPRPVFLTKPAAPRPQGAIFARHADREEHLHPHARRADGNREARPLLAPRGRGRRQGAGRPVSDDQHAVRHRRGRIRPRPQPVEQEAARSSQGQVCRGDSRAQVGGRGYPSALRIPPRPATPPWALRERFLLAFERNSAPWCAPARLRSWSDHPTADQAGHDFGGIMSRDQRGGELGCCGESCAQGERMNEPPLRLRVSVAAQVRCAPARLRRAFEASPVLIRVSLYASTLALEGRSCKPCHARPLRTHGRGCIVPCPERKSSCGGAEVGRAMAGIATANRGFSVMRCLEGVVQPSKEVCTSGVRIWADISDMF